MDCQKLGVDCPLWTPKQDDWTRGYEAEFRRRLEEQHVQVLPIPQVTHEDLLERDLQRRKPFDENGRGYRDALIWESVLSVARHSKSEIVLITKNKKDFGADKPAPDLTADLHRIGIAPSTVRIFESIGVFVEKFVLPKLPAAYATPAQFLQATGKTFDEALQEAVDQALLFRALGDVGVSISEIESPTFDSVESARVMEVVRAAQTDETITLSVRAELRGTFSGYLFKADAYVVDEGEVTVTDWNYNDHYCEVAFKGSVDVDLLVELATKPWKISSVDLQRFSRVEVEPEDPPEEDYNPD